MGIHSPEQIQADQDALAGHRCPETGIDLKPMNRAAVESHIAHHFPHGADVMHGNTDYGRRYRALMAYKAKRFKEVE